MYSIGEFSKITGLTVKTLRFYHEQGILEPSYIDSGNGYRYYADSKIELARVIAALRGLEFSVSEIAEIVGNHDDDSGILQYLDAHQAKISQRMKSDQRILSQLNNIMKHEREATTKMKEACYSVEEKTVETVLVASLRMQGKYSDCGTGFGKIGKKFGRHICGKAMMLCHDTEYRANDANFEVAMPIRKEPIRKSKATDEITAYELPGGRCLSLIHLGPYDELSRSYEKIFKHAKENDYRYKSPTREVYHKGPGMIFRGNPKKYLTEIQLMLED